MENQRITLPSGVELEIQPAAFSVANNLFKTVCRELRNCSAVRDGGLTAARLTGDDLGAIAGAVLQAAGSDDVERCLWECMKTCLYNNARVTRDTFEPAAARGDYLKVAWEVLRANLAPFLSGLDWKSLAEAGAAPKNSQK
jgi:hypothetical protein